MRALLLSAFLLTAAGATRASAQLDAGIALGAQAPAVVINDLEGKPVNLARVIGTKPVLLEFWATWCALCKNLLPGLRAVRQQYGDRIVVYGVNVTVNDSRQRVRRYLENHQPAFQVLYDDKGAGARAFEVPTTSFIVVLDRSGKVVYTGVGGDQDLVAAVRKAFPSG